MKKYVLFSAGALALLLYYFCSCSPARHVGLYRNTIGGQITVDFRRDGTFETTGMGRTYSGEYVLDGDSITVRQAGCENLDVPGPCASTGTFRKDHVSFDTGFLFGADFLKD